MAAAGRRLEDVLGDEAGATAVEYGLVAALIAVAVIVAMTVAGNGLGNLFTAVKDRSTTVFEEADF